MERGGGLNVYIQRDKAALNTQHFSKAFYSRYLKGTTMILRNKPLAIHHFLARLCSTHRRDG